MSGDVLGGWDVRADARYTIRTFSGYSDLQIGPWEGNLSADGSLIALLAKNSSGSKVAFAYNMDTDTKYPDIGTGSLGTIDWVSISAGGNYVVFNHGGDNTSVYTLSGSKVGSTWTQVGRPSHYDLSIDDQGEEVAVGVDSAMALSLSLPPAGMRAIILPAISTDSAGHKINTSWPPYNVEIVASRLDGGRVERIVHHRGVTSD